MKTNTLILFFFVSLCVFGRAEIFSPRNILGGVAGAVIGGVAAKQLDAPVELGAGVGAVGGALVANRYFPSNRTQVPVPSANRPGSYMWHGAAAGAVAGAIVGNQSDDAWKGAAIGTVVGGIAGRMVKKKPPQAPAIVEQHIPDAPRDYPVWVGPPQRASVNSLFGR